MAVQANPFFLHHITLLVVDLDDAHTLFIPIDPLPG